MKKVFAVLILTFLFATMAIFAASYSISSSSTSNSVTLSITSGITVASSCTVNVAYNASVGKYLVDSSGMTLYYFNPPKGTKSFNAELTDNQWIPYYTGKITVPDGLKASDFTVVSENGTQQIAYKGWPLYLFSKDTKPLETNGQGLNGDWYAMTPDVSPAK